VIEMRGKGFVIVFVLAIVMLQMPLAIDAGHSGRKLTWSNGLQINVDVENIDFWATDSVSKLFFSLKLLDIGPILDFKTLIMEVTVVTKINYTDVITIDDPWTSVGDVSKVTAEFTISHNDINGTGWDTYQTNFYYNFSVITDMEGYTDIRYYTNVYEGTPLTISTLSYIVYWPFPPIILVAAVFWVLYIVLRKFNKRYEGLDAEPTANEVPTTGKQS